MRDRRHSRLAGVFAVSAGVLALGAVTAGAGPPGTWTRVTDTNGRNIDEVGLARTRDGALHAVWQIQPGGGVRERLRHASIQPGGQVGAATIALSDLPGSSNP